MTEQKRRYSQVFSRRIKQDVKKLKRDSEMLTRLENKVYEIAIDPSHFKALGSAMKNKRRTHIKHYVLLFEVFEQSRTIHYLRFLHHDVVYR